MTLLVMDTSGDSAVLALADMSGGLRAAKIFEGRRTLSRRLMGEVNALLAAEAMTLDDVTAFGVGIGPGSFTGVRVGVTTVKTWAQVMGKPLVAVPTMHAYASAWGQDYPTLVIILPSRRGEVYAAIYKRNEPPPQAFAESIDALEKRLEALGEQETVLCCGAVELLTRRPVPLLVQAHVPPDGLARVAARRFRDGLTDSPLALTPLYVVPPSISTPKEVRQ